MAGWETQVLEELGRCLLDFVAKEDETMVKLLLEHEQKKLFINYQDDAKKGMTALMIASERGYIGMVKLLLHHGADVNRQSQFVRFIVGLRKVTQHLLFRDINVQLGTTALMMASMNQDVDMAKLLLDHGADVNLEDTDGASSLSITCSSKNDCGLELATLLLDHGTGVKTGLSALVTASRSHSIEIVKQIMKRETPDHTEKGHALSAAVETRDLKMAKLLLEKGAPVRDTLITATKNGDLEMTKLLLKKFSTKTEILRHALVTAVVNRDLKMVKLLIHSEQEAIIDTLITAVWNGDLAMAETLLEQRAPMYRDMGCTLMIAVGNRDLKMTKLLLEQRDRDITTRDDEIGDALIIAVGNRDLEMAKLLLEQGAQSLIDREIQHTLAIKPSVLPEQGDRKIHVGHALKAAVDNRDLEMAKLLLERGAVFDWEIRHTLNAATKNRDLEMAKLLLEQGDRKIYVEDALEIAVDNRDLEMAKLILEQGALTKRPGEIQHTLITAVRNRDLKMVKLLLEQGDRKIYYVGNALEIAVGNRDLEMAKLLLEQRDRKMYYNIGDALEIAVGNIDLKMVKLLLKQGAPTDREIPHTLITAVRNRDLKMVKLLLEQGDRKIYYVGNALEIAVGNRDLEMAKLLLEQRDRKMYYIGDALEIAVGNRDLKMVKLLLGAATDGEIQHALITAILNRDLEMAKLLEQGTPVDHDRETGHTLITAVLNNDLEMAKLLLEQGPPIHKEIGQALIHITAVVNRDLVMTKLLLEQGVPIGSKTGSALVTLCEEQNLQMAELLLKHGADVNIRSPGDGRTALMSACRMMHPETVKLLLEHGADVNVQDNEGMSALMIACKSRHTEVVDLLLKHGASIHLRSEKDGKTALIIASERGYSNIVELLLNFGDMCDNIYSCTALISASENGHIQTVLLLLERGRNINWLYDGNTSALMSAVKENFVRAAKVLLDLGANVNLQNNEGTTALMISAQIGGAETTRLLLNRGANVNLQNNEGTTALMISAQIGGAETTRLLLNRGANVNLQNNEGTTALMISAYNIGGAEVTRLLLDRGANINLQNNEGTTALMISAYIGGAEVTKLLLDRGARLSVNLLDDGKYSALMFACQYGHDRVARLLVEYGADVNLENGNQWSPLMFLISNGKEHIKTVKVFLEKGARVNVQGDDGWTALMLACNNRHTETVDTLVKHGADVNMQRRQNGLTALMIASQKGDTIISETLLKHGADVSMKDKIGRAALMYARQNRHIELAKRLETHETMSTTSVVLASPKSPYPTLKSIHEVTSEDLIAETSLLVTNSEQYFSWNEYGLQIYIPEHSLPEDVGHCNIHIKVSIMGDYQLPQDIHLVSAVYSIKCIPKCHFSKPLILEIQHCAKPENIHKLCFIKSSKTGSKFHIIDGAEGVQTNTFDGFFPRHTSYGFLELDKFCETTIGQKGTAECPRYRANIYRREEDARQHTFHFNIVQDTNAHNELVCQHYERNSMKLQHDQEVEFEEDKIKLDIPFPSDEGIITKDEAWGILSLGPPVITKVQVDSFDKGKRVPSCHLQVNSIKEVPTDLKHVVHLQGAKSPDNAFIISVSARRKRQHDHDFKPRPKHPKAVCKEMTIGLLLKELSSEVSTDWEDIGLYLELKPDHLRRIKCDNPQSCKKCFREMIKVWFQQVDPPPSWSALIEAIEYLEYESLAQELRKKYNVT